MVRGAVRMLLVLGLAQGLVVGGPGGMPPLGAQTPGPVLFAPSYIESAEQGVPARLSGYTLVDLDGGTSAGFGLQDVTAGSEPRYGDISSGGDRVAQLDNRFDEETGQNTVRLTVIDVPTGGVVAVVDDVPRNGGDVAWLDQQSILVSDIEQARTFRVPLDGSTGPEVLFEAFPRELTVAPDQSLLWDGLHLRDADGRVVLRERQGLGDGSWTADSSTLVWPTADGPGRRVIRVLDVASGSASDLATATAPEQVVTPVVAPDGSVVYAFRRAGGAPYAEESFELERIPLAGDGAPEVVFASPVGRQRLTGVAAISHDGRYLALYDLGCTESTCAGGVLDVTTGTVVRDLDDGASAQFLPAGAEVVPGDPPRTERLAGPTRIETAVAVSRATWADAEAAGAVVATAGNFADAQTATPLAVAERGPVLLSPADSLHPATAAELQRILPPNSTVHVVGGTAALSDVVVDQIRNLGMEVVRLAGADRGETSVAIAEAIVEAPSLILFVEGGAFPPGILAGAVAGQRAGAVVVSARAGATYVDQHPDAEVIQIGDSTIGVDADERVLAETPTELSVAVAERFFDPARRVALASAEAFPDGLAGSAHAAGLGVPILLTPRDAAPSALQEHLRAAGVSDVIVYGGQSAVSSAAIRAALSG